MGEREQIIDHLRRVRSLSDCTDEELLSINDLMHEMSIPAGATLAREGEEGHGFVVIADGHATVVKDGHEIAGVMEGSFVGELALLDHKSQTATVTAVTPLRAFVLDPAEFQQLLDRAPTLREKIERAAADRRGSS